MQIKSKCKLNPRLKQNFNNSSEMQLLAHAHFYEDQSALYWKITLAVALRLVLDIFVLHTYLFGSRVHRKGRNGLSCYAMQVNLLVMPNLIK